MLFSNSTVKNIVEKLNPFSQKNKISRLKFERKGDYKTFLKFIKDSTKEIEDIKVPDSEDKKRKGLMIGGGILGLGLLGFAARGKRDSDDSTGKLQSISGVIQKAKADSRKTTTGNKTRRDFKTSDDVLDSARRELFARRNAKRLRIDIINEYRERANKKRRIIKKKYGPKSKIRTKSTVNPTTRRKFAGVTVGGDIPKEQGLPKKGKKITISGGSNIDPDAKIGFPSEKDIKKEKQLNTKKRLENFFNKSRNKEKTQQEILESFNRSAEEADKIGKRAKEIDTKNTNKLRDSFKKSLNQPDASRVNPYNRFDPTAGFMDDDLGQRTGKTTDKVELKPPKKLTQFDKFNRFSNRILNSPAAKFTTFMGGLLANPKFMIIKSLMEPTPLASGTLEGKPGVGVFSEQLMFDEDMAVNIFMPSEGRESMIPFDADIKTPLVTTPTDFPTPSSNIFIDPKQQLNIDDIFFLRSFSGG